MKDVKIDILDFNLASLSSEELIQVSGGGWVADVAYNIGWVVGYLGHAIINGAQLLFGVDVT